MSIKVKVTEKGVYKPTKKGDVRVKVGTTVSLESDVVPSNLVGKCVVVEGTAQDAKSEKTAIKNPQFTEDELKRRNRLIELANKINQDQFTKDGMPDVAAVNQLLDSGETAFTAAERNKLYVEV